MDSLTAKASLGEEARTNPADRGKLGTERHTLVNGRGISLSSMVTEANKHEMKSAFSTIDNFNVDRTKVEQNICMDKEYDFLEIEYGERRREYVDHTRHMGEGVLKKNLNRAKRWVIERTASWHNRFRNY